MYLFQIFLCVHLSHNIFQIGFPRGKIVGPKMICPVVLIYWAYQYVNIASSEGFYQFVFSNSVGVLISLVSTSVGVVN